jgi:hypothetical protein
VCHVDVALIMLSNRVGGFETVVITVRFRNYRNYSCVSFQFRLKQQGLVIVVMTVGSRNCRNYSRKLTVPPDPEVN